MDGYSRIGQYLPDDLVLDASTQIDTMRAVEESARCVGLIHLAEFLHGYGAVTKNVHQRLNFFDAPDKVATTIATFADLAYRPLRYLAAGNVAEICPAWRAFLFHRGPIHRATAMMAGMQVHIERDLPEALYLAPEPESDFFSINGILAVTADQLRPHYLPDGSLWGVLGRGAVWSAVRYIGALRHAAWQRSLSLHAPGADEVRRSAILERLASSAARSVRIMCAANGSALAAVPPLSARVYGSEVRRYEA
jgi:hypothetical protein